MKVGYAFCGSHCTLARSIAAMEALAWRGDEIVPIVSEAVRSTDTRFFSHDDFLARVEKICGRRPIDSVVLAEPLGPKEALDALVIAPCTGNTLAKMASGITDGAVTMAAKAHLRRDRPLLIALATNDALSANLVNIGRLLSRRAVTFVPLSQDDPEKKPHSLVCAFEKIPECLDACVRGVQLRPLFF